MIEHVLTPIADFIRWIITAHPTEFGHFLYAMFVVTMTALVALIVLSFVTMPERMKSAEFFARKHREAQQEWERLKRAKH